MCNGRVVFVYTYTKPCGLLLIVPLTCAVLTIVPHVCVVLKIVSGTCTVAFKLIVDRPPDQHMALKRVLVPV